MYYDDEGCLTVLIRGALLVFCGIVGGLLFSLFAPRQLIVSPPHIDRALISQRIPATIKRSALTFNERRKQFVLFPGEIQALHRTLADSQQQLLTERAFKEQLLKQTHDNKPYIVISLADNMLSLKQRDKTLRECRVATGRQRSEMIQGHLYHFFTPRTVFSIQEKIRDPKWTMPDWAYREQGVNPPPMSERAAVPGVLGKYALRLQGGYLIHGTINDASLGKYITHGCIRMSERDLKAIFDYVPAGTKVYIY